MPLIHLLKSEIPKYCASLAVAAGLLFSHRAQAVTLPYYDGFNYSEGILNNVGGPNWFAGNTGAEISVTNPAALTAPEGFPAASGKGVRRAPSGTARRSVIQYTSVPAVDANTMYVSFLLNVQSAPGSAQLIGFLDNNSSSQGSPQAGIFVDSGPKVGVGKKSSSPGFTMANNLGAGTHLVVVRYTFQSGNDRVDLWVDPPSSTYGAGTPPASLGSTTGGTDPASLDYFQFYSSPSAGSFQFIDEFRLGTTWADVVPSGAPPVGQKLGFTTQPGYTAPGATMNPVVVQVQNSGGAAVASNGVPVTLTLSSGSGTLSGTTTRSTDPSGQVIFNDLSVDTEGNDKQLTANASGIGTGLLGAVSDVFTISSTPLNTNLTITAATMRPSGFALNGINGMSNGLYNVLASPDPGLPMSSWIAATYGYFNASGTFAITNPVSAALPAHFYRLLAGTSNTKLVPPSITQPPVSQTVSPGTTAIFTVEAVGPLLHYLWYFNGSPLPDATNATLTISNAQAGNAGNYHVIVANGAGSATSSTATLAVGNIGPSIITHPENQTVTMGGTAIFTVTANGTAPLGYQWYYYGITPLPGGTGAQLTLNDVQTNQAGTYSVVVSNAFGSISSAAATLSVTEVPTAPPITNMMGYAALADVTGGAGGAVVLATNYYWLSNYVRRAEPLIIQVQGTLTSTETYTYVYAHNKTIIGIGTDAGLIGDLRINATNIIVQNMSFSSPTQDGITIDTGSGGRVGQYVWVDHCTFYDCKDGSLDVVKGADYVTVSWCKFYYNVSAPHNTVNLVGASDTEALDPGKLHVTFHHNWYSTNCLERMPSVRFGRAHVFNNYYDCVGNNYCVRTRLYAQVLVENNYFIGVQNPWERLVTSAGGDLGLLYASGNITNNCTWVAGWYGGVSLIPGTDTLSDLNPPPYSYTLIPASDVPYYVRTYAGSGKYPYVP